MWGVNLGDTEVFLLRGGELRPLSERHAMSGPESSHVITRGLGLESSVSPHLFSWKLAAGDRVLICTDGVTRPLSRERLGLVLVGGRLGLAEQGGEAGQVLLVGHRSILTPAADGTSAARGRAAEIWRHVDEWQESTAESSA